MKLVDMKCPQCGGALEVPDDQKQIKCPFCGTPVFLDDEVQHVQFDNTEQAGYNFGKGMARAQQEAAIKQSIQEIEAKQGYLRTQQEYLRAQQEAERKKKNRKWWILGWIFCFPIPLTILIAKSKKLKPLLKFVLIAALWAAIIIIGAANSKDGDTTKTNVETNSIWAITPAPLDNFDYYIDGESITLTDYEKWDKKVNISPTYEVDGGTYRVTAIEGVFTLKSVSSVIIPEGVTKIKHNAFNSCGVEYLYLPATLTEFDGWSYFHDGEKLYFGGTEEQWNALYTGDRNDLDFKQIIFNAKIDDLIKPIETEQISETLDVQATN